jgi:hypothetical protein
VAWINRILETDILARCLSFQWNQIKIKNKQKKIKKELAID